MDLPSKSLEIRRATTDDLAEVLRLERSVPEAPHWDASVYRDILLQEPAGSTLQRALFVAVDHGQLAGFAVATVVADQAELESIAVDPQRRRLGVGRALSESVMAWAREAGARQILLEVRSANAVARALYGRLGFQETGLRRGYYSDPSDDAVLMSVSLSAAADL
ncbi:ribosomal protein S18-alanine N-acetyltransferase [Granulicella mallensis]|uniref:Ribosomal-protein-alanine acetyltransferase n=1 Tax=Granulicella mallensis (strain ATCC BAA-1857 / DSM 23137 / MP5ACTX8) TaxID=682795 RepID=G8NUR5_GRAMM|nr:ribosomal protein S18-alanine N-acetyltransferase [Granulicella mallensis]AEU37605.1 ribosomal-protein-alanine acetyltransferase [Granulicella mallensis MP5ACTX8]